MDMIIVKSESFKQIWFVYNINFCVTFFYCLFVLSCIHFLDVHVQQEKENDLEEGEEDASASNLQKLRTTATMLFQLNQAIRQLHSSLSTTLRGEVSDVLKMHV